MLIFEFTFWIAVLFIVSVTVLILKLRDIFCLFLLFGFTESRHCSGSSNHHFGTRGGD